MKLNQFNLADNNIAVQKDAEQFDLHNCFIYVGSNYDVINQELSLRWIKGFGEKVTDKLPDELLFEFTGVSFFKARERDVSKPYPRDEFLKVMGFMDNSRVEEIGGDYTHQPSDDSNHLCLEFGSGFAMKFDADEATLMTKVNI